MKSQMFLGSRGTLIEDRMTQRLSTNRRREDLGQPGPAMRNLPNDRWRLFVETYPLGDIHKRQQE